MVVLCFTTPTLDCVAPFNPPEACIQQQYFIKLSTVLGTVPVLYLGLGFGGSPHLQQQKRRGVSICTENSSVQVTSSKMLLCPLKMLRFIALENQLAVSTASERPPQSSVTSEDRLQSHVVALALKENMLLHGGRLIIVHHLLLHDCPHCRCHLSRSALYAPCFVVFLQKRTYLNAASSQVLQ